MKKHSVTIFALLFTSVFACAAGPALSAEAADWFSAGSLDEKSFGKAYVPPVSGLLNETPFITTEIRPIYAYHEIPDDSVTAGGYGHVAAVQLRLALSERLAIIATKDGYTDLHFSQALPDTDGFNNLAAGLKYALISDPASRSILSVGGRYEIPTGNLPTAGIDLAGADGDGLIDVFVTGARSWDKFTIQGSIGSNIALDQDKNSTELHYSVHMDYELLKNLFPLIEVNGLTTLENGKVIALDLEGGDLMNIGTADSGTVITLAVGLRYRLNDHAILGVAWEPSVSKREDLHEERVYVDLVWHY
jgi:hypothetical protein